MATKKAENILEKVLFIPDCHIPYHDHYAFDLMMKAARAFKPQHIIILGDFIDMYSVSAHDKNPARALKLEYEIGEAIKCLAEIQKLGAKNNVYIAGNHEDRLTRYMMQKAPELYERMKIPDLLALRAHGFSYVAYKDDYQLGKLNMTHDTGKAGKYANYQSMADYGRSTIIGHTHRMAYAVTGNADGDCHLGAMFGWLGDFKQVDYMHKIKAKVDWAHGFGIGYYNPKNKYVYVVPVPIVKYTCVIEGKLYD